MPGGTLIAIIFLRSRSLRRDDLPAQSLRSTDRHRPGKTPPRPRPACAVIGIIGAAVSLLIQGIVSDWMDVLSIYICPLGAGLAGIMFFWVFGKTMQKRRSTKVAKRNFQNGFVPVCRYIYIPVCVLVLILGIALGGIDDMKRMCLG